MEGDLGNCHKVGDTRSSPDVSTQKLIDRQNIQMESGKAQDCSKKFSSKGSTMGSSNIVAIDRGAF